MVRYRHLPIYRKALELVVFIENVVKNFSRYHKYTAGMRLREVSWDIVVLVVRVNSTPLSHRKGLFIKLRDRVEEANIALDVARELGAFQYANSYRYTARLAVDLGRQSEGWLKSASKMTPPGHRGRWASGRSSPGLERCSAPGFPPGCREDLLAWRFMRAGRRLRFQRRAIRCCG